MSMFNKVTKTFQWGQHSVTLETGEIARQAGGAVIVNIEDTMVLATVVGAKNAKPGQDFFPLTVDYIEKTYAAGKIPGSFFKREGRPSELETLTSRLIDRPLRPLFPEGFYNEVQVVIHVLSLNPEIAADIPALIGASAAMAISGLPFNGPLEAGAHSSDPRTYRRLAAGVDRRRRRLRQVQGRQRAVRHRCQDRSQKYPVRRAAHRRPRHPHRAADRDPQRRAAARSRLGALHAR